MQNKRFIDFIIIGVITLSLCCVYYLNYSIDGMELLNLPVGEDAADAEYVNDGYTTEWSMLKAMFKIIRNFLLP